MACQSALARLLPLLAASVVQAARVAVHQHAQLTDKVAGPPLCAEAIVAETCQMISGGTTDVSAGEVQKILAADDTAFAAAWETMDLPAGERVSCGKLCTTVVDLIGEHWTLPPSSDVGCYMVGDVTKCDLDLSPEALGLLVPKDEEMPDLHDDVELPPEIRNRKGKKDQGPKVVAHSKTVDYATHDILVRQANLFRIYPTPAFAFVQEVPEQLELALLEENGTERRVASHGKCDVTFCGMMENSCQFPHSCGACPKCASGGGAGAGGNSGNGIGATYGTCDDVCHKVDTPCKYYNCRSCPQCRSGDGNVVRAPSPPPPPPPGLGVSTADAWKAEVQKRNVQAQAYVNKAIMKLKSRQAERSTVKWFGATANTDQHIQEEMLRVLNSVANMMGNVEYVYPGPQCSPNTYAYVYPRGSLAKDKSGKYVFYLCRLYMDSEVSVQIETLTHEGSHHATSYTDDVCMDEYYGPGKKPTYVEVPKNQFPPSVTVDDTFDYRTSGGARAVPAVVRIIKGSVVVLQLEPERDCKTKAYGRQPCADLAKQDAVKALRNADNVCYWIQDVAEQG